MLCVSRGPLTVIRTNTLMAPMHVFIVYQYVWVFFGGGCLIPKMKTYDKSVGTRTLKSSRCRGLGVRNTKDTDNGAYIATHFKSLVECQQRGSI
jgi:hypothetical protein